MRRHLLHTERQEEGLRSEHEGLRSEAWDVRSDSGADSEIMRHYTGHIQTAPSK